MAAASAPVAITTAIVGAEVRNLQHTSGVAVERPLSAFASWRSNHSWRLASWAGKALICI
jgi:hypothetical protein